MAALLIALALLAIPGYAHAVDAEVTEYVDRAVESVRSTCYEARMTYLSPFDQGLEQQVHIHHVAPELYRVVPLEKGGEGDTVYIENAVELTRIRNGYAETMPLRQFYTNDNLTIKFLRDLGRHDGTVLLDGKAGGRDVYVLRQDVTAIKPYTITVGLDQGNYFPVFLLVLDATGQRRVYYEMDVIEYYEPSAIPDHLFMLASDYKQLPAPRVKSLSDLQVNAEDAASSNLPMIPSPSSLPDGYRLETISALDFRSVSVSPGESQVVYQLEVYGPMGDLLSIFQTKNPDFDLDGNSPIRNKDSQYIVALKDGWTVAIFGSFETEQLEAVLDGLHLDLIKAEQLLKESQLRRQLLYVE